LKSRYFPALSENARAFSRFFFVPRIMRPVANCDPSTTILGYRTGIPIFVGGAALARLGHPLGSFLSPVNEPCENDAIICSGEINITRGTAASSIIQMVSSNASLSYGSIIAAAAPSQVLFFQLYKHANDKIAETRVREVEALGYKAIWLTVDAIVAGNRERDIKAPWVVEEMEQKVPALQTGAETLDDTEVDMGGMAGAMVKNDDRNMTWEKVG
jgi:L-lactate dehydrogenase (cytochrome)